ncbi:SH3 domain-containing protein [Iodidimonas sp. SYSU 1G8]|uniref:SH3 domain-containing protein n=1 Tax=Iodidimonas sp. SYSU 1G8 TaxID=3133967 RepID=UPI0031FEBF38
MIKSTLATAALLVGASLFTSASAHALPGYTTARVQVKAGPDLAYPTVGSIKRGAPLRINGCLRDWSWCEVTARRDRGWIRGDLVAADYRGRRVNVIQVAPRMNLPVISFSFRSYWDNHYRDRGFYRDRGRWERHWSDHRRGPDHRGDIHRRDRDRPDHRPHR